MLGLTKKQKAILEHIKSHILEHGESPTFRELQSHFKFSSLASVHSHIHALKKKGALAHAPHLKRALIPKQENTSGNTEIPFIGRLGGGEPLELFATTQKVAIPSMFVPNPSTCYLLEIRGSALTDEGILAGDRIVVEATEHVPDGAQALLLVDGITLIRKVTETEEGLQLISSNPHIAPLLFPLESVQIQGVIRSLFRV